MVLLLSLFVPHPTFLVFVGSLVKKKAHGSDMQSVVATERRALLMKEILDEAAFRNSVTDEVEQQRYRKVAMGNAKSEEGSP